MKKNYMIEDLEFATREHDSYRLDTHGHNEEEMLDNMEVAVMDDEGYEVSVSEYGECEEWIQEKALAAIRKELKREVQ